MSQSKDAITALAANAVERKLFISHKAKDERAALCFERMLKKKCGNTLNILLSEKIKPGVLWHPKILQDLSEADTLILLYTDPSDEWDWCLFEAGFFAGKKTSVHPLICIHSTAEAPSPLRQWQTICISDTEKMVELLKNLIQPHNEAVADDDEELKTLADELRLVLLQQGRGKAEPKWKTKYLLLDFIDPLQVKKLTAGCELADNVECGVEAEECIEIFGYMASRCTVETIRKGIPEKERKWWLSALTETLRAAALQHYRIPPIPDIYSPATENEYHVILHRIDRYQNGTLRFCLLFIQKPRETELGRTPELKLLGDMLTLGRKLRWQILEKYRYEITILQQKKRSNGASKLDQEIRHQLESFKDCLEMVGGESERRGLRMADDVLNAFEKVEDRKSMDRILRIVWPKLFYETTGVIEKVIQSGEDQSALEEGQLAKVLDGIKGMLEMNREFMIRTAGRYQELLEKQLPRYPIDA